MRKLNFRKWLFLFFTTLGIGGLSGVVVGMVLDMPNFSELELSFWEVAFSILWLFGVGMTFSAISQMAFFAYLLVHRLGLGMFKSEKLWRQIQIILIAFVFFDLVYFRYAFFGEPGGTWLVYMILPSVLLISSLPFAYIKAKETHQQAFVPALFLLFVITTIASLPALRADDLNWIVLMMVSIFVCFAWQLLLLHRLTRGSAGQNT